MSDQRKMSEEAVERLAARKGVLAAAIIGRDGLPMMTRFARSANQEAVCAMSAAILGAGDAALLDVTGEEADGFTVVSKGHALAGAALGPDMLLIVLTNTAAAKDARGILEEAALSLRGVLKQA